MYSTSAFMVSIIILVTFRIKKVAEHALSCLQSRQGEVVTSPPKHETGIKKKRLQSPMAGLIEAFVATLVLCLLTRGLCDCSLDKINIGTVRSGREISGQAEWNVTVVNNCQCPQSQIQLSCTGFQTVEKIDPSILSKQGDTCLLINGSSLEASASVYFSYAWDPPFLLLPLASVIHGC